MEILLFIIGAIVLFSLMSGGSSSSSSSSSWTPPSGGSSSAPKRTGDEYFGPLQVRALNDDDNEHGFTVKRIQIRGELPVPRSMNVSFMLSAFDVTEDDPEFVFSLVEAAQESETICYQVTDEIGKIDVGDAFIRWTQLGVIIPDFIQPPRSGKRKIRVVVRLFNTNNPPSISAGFGTGDGVFTTDGVTFEHNFTEKGYQEESEHREEAQAIALKIGVAVAMSDGNLDESEGQTLKDWIVREISAFSDEKKERLKTIFNDALKEAFADSRNNQLSLSPLVERLAEIGDKKSKYDAIELCFDVMAADGQADPEEMRVIRTVAEALDLDMDEIESMREKVTLNLSTELSGEDGLEALVGLRAEWSNDEKKTHLRKEFQKWSNRLNALDEGEEREQAQNMLDSIAKLRKKYG